VRDEQELAGQMTTTKTPGQNDQKEENEPVRPPYGIPPAGFRLPDETRIGAVRLQVRDLERSLNYYERVLGLQVQARTADSAMLGAADSTLPLVQLQAKEGVRPAPRRGAFGLYHFAILLPERAALGRFAAHLSRLDVRTGMADHLVSEALYLTDPDGLGNEVYADRPRCEWQVAGRELAMTTEPLDVRDLLAAGGAQPWRGAPPGTTMGHVHLHVGSLDAAEAFYHVGLGFDTTVWSYPGALFFSAGGYHHHLGTNTWAPGPSAADDEARLLEWEIAVPYANDSSDVARSLRASGFAADDTGRGVVTADPWGTRVRIVAAATPLRT
jgi:catechol 2,3-dioxygenase